MRGTAFGIYSNKSRGLPMVIFKQKWHAEAWIDGSLRTFGGSWNDYHIKRIHLERDNSLKVFHVSEDLGYKTKPFRKLRSLKEI